MDTVLGKEFNDLISTVMKKITLMAFAAIALALTGCNEAKKLAGEVAGTWSSTPQMLVNDPGSQATFIESITFVNDSTGVGGAVIISSMVSSTGSLQGNGALIQPFEMAASARAEVTGTWVADDDDEIILRLDVSKMTVAVDPSGLVLSTNALTGQEQPDATSLKPEMAKMVEGAVRRQLVARYSEMTRLDDVKVRTDQTGVKMLKFEVGKKDYEYASQTPASQK